MTHRILIASTLLVLATLGTARAGIFVDSGMPDESGNRSVFANPGLPGAQFAAQQFTLNSASTVTRIETYLGGGAGRSATAHLTTAIGGGTTAGDVITSFVLATPGTGPNQGAWVGHDEILNLSAATYFMVYSGDTNGGFLPIEAPNDIGPSFTAGDNVFPFTTVDTAFPPASSFFQTGTATRFGLRILPEPASIGLVMLGGLAMMSRRRGKE